MIPDRLATPLIRQATPRRTYPVGGAWHYRIVPPRDPLGRERPVPGAAAGDRPTASKGRPDHLARGPVGGWVPAEPIADGLD